MTDYFDKDDAKKAFIRIAKSKPSLKGVADGQLIDMIGTHIGLAAEAAFYNAERLFQESYLSTALNRTSILASSYDRNYVPRKPKPSNGSIRIVNKTDVDKSFPAGAILISEDQVKYESTMPSVIKGGHNTLVSVLQVERETLTFSVDNPTPFYEIKLESEKSRRVHGIKIWVNGYLWDKSILFRNTNQMSNAWVEFYTPLDELGVRFGNGIFGKIPEVDSTVKIELILTEGDVTLINDQVLSPIDPNNAYSGLEFVSGTVLSGGADIEETEEIRRNALYYFQYDENHEWSDDYVFMLQQKFPQLLFCKSWGEEKQEKMVGYRSVDHINHIFFSVYSPFNKDVHIAVKKELELIPEYNRYFTHIPYTDKKFTFKIEGTIKRSLILSEVEDEIKSLVEKYYGKDSIYRFQPFLWKNEGIEKHKTVREKVLVRDFYRMMNRLSHNNTYVFESQDDVFITLSGNTTPDKLYDFVSVDIDNSVVEISYD